MERLAYEVNGNIEKALEYIKKGMKLNPDSHNGSEWVHVKILETKLKLRDDENYLSNNTVLNLSKYDHLEPLIRDQINIQVRERFPFSPKPNQIMASLLIDLGDCYSQTSSIEFAKTLYTIAREYHGAKAEMVEAKIKEMVRLRTKYDKIEPDPKGDKETNHVKVVGIPYTRLLGDNNLSEHEIIWQEIETDINKLLEYARSENKFFNEKKSKVSNRNNNEILYLIILLGIALMVFIVYKTKK